MIYNNVQEIELEFRSVGFVEERKLEENPRSKDENQQQTHIIYLRIIDIMRLL